MSQTRVSAPLIARTEITKTRARLDLSLGLLYAVVILFEGFEPLYRTWNYYEENYRNWLDFVYSGIWAATVFWVFWYAAKRSIKSYFIYSDRIVLKNRFERTERKFSPGTQFWFPHLGSSGSDLRWIVIAIRNFHGAKSHPGTDRP